MPTLLADLISWLSRLPRLYKEWTEGNPWREPPEAVVQQGLPAVRGYFVDLFAEGSTVHRTNVKVIIVGQEGVGKTR